MGLLDEAIREHLDLKRRHGADPAEIDRAEKEALGPVRRGPEEPLDLPSEPAAGSSEEPGDEGEEPVAHEPPLEDSGLEPSGLHEPGSFDEQSHSPHPADLDEDERLAPTEEQEALSAHDDDEEPPAPEHSDRVNGLADKPDASRSDPIQHPGEETAEYDVELEEKFDKPREDVLEETPEFLQDTPDHDRLWFEQRPPRDFDFDD